MGTNVNFGLKAHVQFGGHSHEIAEILLLILWMSCPLLLNSLPVFGMLPAPYTLFIFQANNFKGEK
jgi:hypothetical protein